MDTPLWHALEQSVQTGRASGHTPGHKNGHLVPHALRKAWGSEVWRYDKTEIEGLDNLAHPEGVLKESMEGWAHARGAVACQYLLGGTSLGLKASILALARGKKIFLPRHAHHSMIEALVLSGSEPIFLEVDFDEELGIPLGVSPRTLDKAAAKHPDCKLMMLVHPTYHGITYRNKALVACAKGHGITVVADAAHGAHFCATPGIDDALSIGCEVVVESAHKTLPCLTQASVMFINRCELVTPLREAVALLHTTSPSYLLMASLEMAGAWLMGLGRGVIKEGLARLDELEREIEKQDVLRLERHDAWGQDPFKLYFTAKGVSGETLGDLFRKYGLECEMTDGRGALIIAPLDGALDVSIVKKVEGDAAHICESIPSPCYLDKPLTRALSVGEAFFAPKERLALRDVQGRVAAEILEAYPPGIPLLLPGEVVDDEVVAAWTASGRNDTREIAVVCKSYCHEGKKPL